MGRIFQTPKARMAAGLFILSILAIWQFFSLELVLRLLIILSTTLILEYLLWKIRKIPSFLPSAGVVTALIIFLLADPKTPLWFVMVAVFAAIILKQFFRPNNNHIFNPAGSGLLVAGFLGLPITWWGISWGTIPLIATIIIGSLGSLYSIRQERVIFPFILVSFLASSLILGHPVTALNQLLVGSFWFFTLVMLPEPQTSAHFPNTKIFYGSFVAILPFLIAEFGLPDALLASLLIGNLGVRIIEDLGFKQ